MNEAAELAAKIQENFMRKNDCSCVPGDYKENEGGNTKKSTRIGVNRDARL
jgi:hypothetical protein